MGNLAFVAKLCFWLKNGGDIKSAIKSNCILKCECLRVVTVKRRKSKFGGTTDTLKPSFFFFYQCHHQKVFEKSTPVVNLETFRTQILFG